MFIHIYVYSVLETSYESSKVTHFCLPTLKHLLYISSYYSDLCDKLHCHLLVH
jgi:hypothetical protein